jgi:hypothetical protein
MAKNSITDYSKTAASNTDIQSVDIDEGCLPSGINNAIREIMADLADMNDGTVTLTSPSFAAASLTGNLSFGDNDKAIFGAGSDLQIHHNGTNSIVADVGQGTLSLQSNGAGITLWDSANSQELAQFYTGAVSKGVTLSRNGVEKLATTASGIDVTGNATFDDNGKAIFGAGSDLQIYHSGSHSYIDDSGTGNLYIRAADNLYLQKYTGETFLQATADGEVRITHNNSTKLATTSTGINVTGTVTADGLTAGDFNVEGNADYSVEFRGTDPTVDRISLQSRFRDDTDASYWGGSNVAFIRDGNWQSSMQFNTAPDYANRNGLTRIKIASNGDISFYEDTGTTAKLFWDASEERLGLGTTSPNDRVQVNGELSVTANDAAYADEYFAKLKSEYGAIALALETRAGDVIQASNFGQELTFLTGPNSTGTVERLRITSAGLVGIGIASPLGQLHINTETAEATKVYVDGEANQPKSIEIRHYDTSEGSGAGRNLFYLKTPASGRLDIGNFSDGSSETQLMTFLESGNVGIGTSSPARTLHVHASQPYLHMTNPVTGSATTDGLSILVGQTNGEALIIQRENQPIQIYTNGSERMRIDNSGNLLVGTTNPDVANSASVEGISIRGGSNFLGIARSGASVAKFNRQSNDGAVVQFAKDGATVGSIGVASGDLNINGGANHSGIRFQATGLYPLENGTVSSGEIDLGAAGSKFKNLYLSGGVYLGGTGSANHLDDYEEGTWTPVISHVSSFSSATITSIDARYTKIGRQVTLEFEFSLSSSTGNVSAGDDIVIASGCLPFTPSFNGHANGTVGMQVNMPTGEDIAMAYAGFSGANELGIVFHTVSGTVARTTVIGGIVTYFV